MLRMWKYCEEVRAYKDVVTAAFLNCLPQSGVARSMVSGMRPNGCGSMARREALVLESAEKVRKAVDLGNPAGILMVWGGDLKCTSYD